MTAPDLVCLSHLRWDFVYQRPNHLMSRAARDRRVFFVEPPTHSDVGRDLEIESVDGVHVVRPVLPVVTDESALPPLYNRLLLRRQMNQLVRTQRIQDPWLWYYNPLASRWTDHLSPSAVIYDCMDELSAFRHASADLPQVERSLVKRSDVVFAGGRRLYEAKRDLHPRTYLFPSSVDRDHFACARQPLAEPVDQTQIARPRVGYFGVIDERLDLQLLSGVADARPGWQFVMVGPTAKVERHEIPLRPNIHWLGQKAYGELPSYLAGWDVALMPFALNDSTRHISPTKTLEYLAGGRRVVSSAIEDVVEPYGRLGLVEIASGTEEFVAAIDRALSSDPRDHMARADKLLAETSWDRTWSRMDELVRAAVDRTRTVAA